MRPPTAPWVYRGSTLRWPDPLPTYLGALGTTGLTAYFALFEDRPDPGRGHRGHLRLRPRAVGSVAGQIAKIKGCRVIGIAGGPEKCRALTEEFGFDAAIDYRKPRTAPAALRELAPGGVDVYFDNVGGEILDDVLTCLARGRQDRDLRRDLAVQRDSGPGPGQLHDAAGGPGVHDRHAGVRLRRPVPRGHGRARPAGTGQGGWSRASTIVHGGVTRLPRDAADAVRGREHRQADPGPGRKRLTFRVV